MGHYSISVLMHCGDKMHSGYWGRWAECSQNRRCHQHHTTLGQNQNAWFISAYLSFLTCETRTAPTLSLRFFKGSMKVL